jgi:hypothetical protein
MPDRAIEVDRTAAAVLDLLHEILGPDLIPTSAPLRSNGPTIIIIVIIIIIIVIILIISHNNN